MRAPRRLLVPLVALLASAAIFAADAAPPTVSSVVRRWIAATGGEKAWRRVASATLSGDAVEAGIAGTFEGRVARDGFAFVTMQQTDRREEACTETHVWLRDWNGHVRELEGRDRADARAAALIASLLYAGGMRDLTGIPARVEAGPAAGDPVVLKLTPAETTPVDVVFDAATGLPSKLVRKPYDDALVTAPSGWKTVGGVKVPFVLTESGAEDDTHDTTTLRAYAVRRKAPDPPFARPKDGPADVAFASGKAALGIPFNFENDHLMIDGRVNGSEPIWFMLDTGAETTIINRPRMASFGLTPFGASSIEGGGNSTDFANTKVARLSFPGVEITNQRDGVIDLTGLEKIYGRAMGGILGYDFFSRFVVRVDYDKKTIDLLDPAGYAYSGPGKPVPFIIEAGHPHVASTITVPGAAPIPADMVIDCGAADTANLCSPFVRAHNLLELARKKPAGAPNVLAGSEKEFFAQTSVRGRLSSLTLGPFTIENIPNNLMVAKTGGYATESWSGTIGEGILRRFNAVYDYARSVLVLEPNAEFGKPFSGRKSFGATYLSEGPDYKTFRVTAVRKDSPADAAGLRKEDVITAIDGTPATGLTLAGIRRMLTDDGAKHAVTVKRGDETVTLDVTVTLFSLDDE